MMMMLMLLLLLLLLLGLRRDLRSTRTEHFGDLLYVRT